MQHRLQPGEVLGAALVDELSAGAGGVHLQGCLRARSWRLHGTGEQHGQQLCD